MCYSYKINASKRRLKFGFGHSATAKCYKEIIICRKTALKGTPHWDNNCCSEDDFQKPKHTFYHS